MPEPVPVTPPSLPSVLLSFRARNVRSFRDEFEFSMLATALSEAGVPRSVRWRDSDATIEVLPAAAIFGGNASGKTNVFRAMDDMRTIVLQSFRQAPTRGMPHRPFRLDPASLGEPSRFEIDLVIEGVRHQYGFEFDQHGVIEEWAFRYPHGRAAALFVRSGDHVELGSAERAKGRAVRELMRPNALFLSTAAHANHPILLKIYRWFSRNLLLAESASRAARQAYTVNMLEDDETSRAVIALLQAADIGISGARRYELDEETRERMQRIERLIAGEEDAEGVAIESMLEDLILLQHRGTDESVEFGPDEESRGTLVWLGLIGPVVAALANGSVLLADELDASLHPMLVAELVRLFQSKETNPNRAQLVFNTHALTLLGDSRSERTIGRDQIWFTEKEDEGSSRLFPLTDLEPRKDEAIQRRYLAGRYGATPMYAHERFREIAELMRGMTQAD
jgi:uncharacterized protein